MVTQYGGRRNANGARLDASIAQYDPSGFASLPQAAPLYIPQSGSFLGAFRTQHLSNVDPFQIRKRLTSLVDKTQKAAKERVHISWLKTVTRLPGNP